MHRILNDKKFIRYILSGSATFSSEYLTFLVLETLLGLNVNVSHSLSFCVGICMSFSLNYMWVFKDAGYAMKVKHQMVLYLALAIFNLLMTNLLIYLLVSWGMHPVIGKLALMIMIIVWNFWVFRQVIFKPKRS